MARQFRDKDGRLWIASKFGSTSSGAVSVGLPLSPAKMDLDQIEMEEHGTDRKLLATLPAGQWQYASDDELRDALEQALILYQNR